MANWYINSKSGEIACFIHSLENIDCTLNMSLSAMHFLVKSEVKNMKGYAWDRMCCILLRLAEKITNIIVDANVLDFSLCKCISWLKSIVQFHWFLSSSVILSWLGEEASLTFDILQITFSFEIYSLSVTFSPLSWCINRFAHTISTSIAR